MAGTLAHFYGVNLQVAQIDKNKIEIKHYDYEGFFNKNDTFDIRVIDKNNNLDNVKYAKKNRTVNSSTDTVSTENKNVTTNTIDELSMKIFRQLKSDISLECSRVGR